MLLAEAFAQAGLVSASKAEALERATTAQKAAARAQRQFNKLAALAKQDPERVSEALKAEARMKALQRRAAQLS